MYYASFGLLALLILIGENYDILLKRNGAFETRAWKVYRRFLFAVGAYYAVDALWGILEKLKAAELLFADTTLYFILISVGILFWVEYTVAYLEESTGFGRFLIAAGRVVAGTITLLAVFNIFTPLLFTVEADGAYCALPGRYVMLVAQILLLLLISLYAIISMLRRHAEKRGRYRTLAAFGLIMALFLFLQLWFPYYPLYTVAYLLGTSLLHTFVINEEKERYRRGLENAAEIKELKDTISSLLDNMPGMTFTKDAQTGVYLACNQAFAEYSHKRDPQGVVGLTAAQIFDAKTADHFVADDQIALAMDKPYIYFEDVPDAAGNQRQLQTTKIKYTDASGRLCVLGICEDITDMARVQRENATTQEAYEKARSAGLMYTHIAQALARGYKDLYYVNVDTEEFIQYNTGGGNGAFTEVRRGWHFFEECAVEAERRIHPDDRAAFIKAMDRHTLLDALGRNNIFAMTYRSLSAGGSAYVSMRVSRMEDDERFIVIGVTDVDEQMKERRAAERMKEEQIAYARLKALNGDFLCVYIVVPETGRYREFSSANEFEAFSQKKEGMDFFAATREAARKFAHPEDLNHFLTVFTRENVMAEIRRSGIFTVSYRLIMEGKPVYVQLRAAMVQEKEGLRMIAGVINIDAQVHQEEDYGKRLAQAQIKANVDALTGVKNKHAYLNATEKLNRLIGEGSHVGFAVTILDVNDLKKINDTKGHQAGDQYIREACMFICRVFDHSPVFRVGGDEFVVISQGADYAGIDGLIRQVDAHNEEASRTGGIVIAHGMAKYEGDASVETVFRRADQRMYANKSSLKAKNRAQ